MIVDGMNVIGSRPTGWWRDRDAAVRGLLARLQRYHQETGEAVTVVLDGRPASGVPEGVHGGVRICYAHTRARDAADDRIVQMLTSHGAEPVVTSDRALRRRAAELGAEVRGAQDLLRRLDRLDQVRPPSPP